MDKDEIVFKYEALAYYRGDLEEKGREAQKEQERLGYDLENNYYQQGGGGGGQKMEGGDTQQ